MLVFSIQTTLSIVLFPDSRADRVSGRLWRLGKVFLRFFEVTAQKPTRTTGQFGGRQEILSE